MYSAATGIDCTWADLATAGDRTKLIFRAILMRNSGRCRDLEVDEAYPYITYPDPNGEVCTWDEWNDAVDLMYEARGWDLTTGWPLREAGEAVGLKDIADEMEKLEKLPSNEGSREYPRKSNPTGR
jgi:aldehyde:ferredoxin oxidoreductase